MINGMSVTYDTVFIRNRWTKLITYNFEKSVSYKKETLTFKGPNPYPDKRPESKSQHFIQKAGKWRSNKDDNAEKPPNHWRITLSNAKQEKGNGWDSPRGKC